MRRVELIPPEDVQVVEHGRFAEEVPVVAQASLDLNGRVLQAKVAATTAREAVDLLEARLRQRLVRAARNWQAIRGRVPNNAPHEWRHGQATQP